MVVMVSTPLLDGLGYPQRLAPRGRTDIGASLALPCAQIVQLTAKRFRPVKSLRSTYYR